MSIVQRGSKVYASIKDLPVVTSVTDGMKFIMHTEDGTVLADYADVSVDLDHTTFGQTFRNMLDLTNSIQTFIDTVTSQITEFDEKVDEIKRDTKVNTDTAAALKVFIRMISTGTNGLDDPSFAKNYLEGDALEIWNSIYDNLNIEPSLKDKFFSDFNLYNLYH